MKQFMFIMILLVSTNLFGQSDSVLITEGKHQFRFHFTPALFSTKDVVAEELGMSNIGISWLRMGIGFTVYHYFFFDGGFGIAYFKDKKPFKELVTGGFGGDIPHDAKSSLTSGDFYYNIGLKSPLFRKFGTEISLGRSNYSITRSIDRCKDCSKDKLEITGGTFIQSSITYSMPPKKGKLGTSSYYLSYSHFVGNSSFKNFISIGIIGFYNI